jgi:hypothetical protein
MKRLLGAAALSGGLLWFSPGGQVWLKSLGRVLSGTEVEVRCNEVPLVGLLGLGETYRCEVSNQGFTEENVCWTVAATCPNGSRSDVQACQTVQPHGLVTRTVTSKPAGCYGVADALEVRDVHVSLPTETSAPQAVTQRAEPEPERAPERGTTTFGGRNVAREDGSFEPYKPYPTSEVNAFMTMCRKKASAQVCKCAIENAQYEWSLSLFRAWWPPRERGKLSEALMDQVNSCREYAEDDAEDDRQDKYNDAAERWRERMATD